MRPDPKIIMSADQLLPAISVLEEKTTFTERGRVHVAKLDMQEQWEDTQPMMFELLNERGITDRLERILCERIIEESDDLKAQGFLPTDAKEAASIKWSLWQEEPEEDLTMEMVIWRLSDRLYDLLGLGVGEYFDTQPNTTKEEFVTERKEGTGNRFIPHTLFILYMGVLAWSLYQGNPVLGGIMLIGIGGILNAVCFAESQRGMKGFPIQSVLIYNFRGMLHLVSAILILVAVFWNFRADWSWGLISILAGIVSPIAHIMGII